jgi:rhodanese-related sulfurtransferase
MATGRIILQAIGLIAIGAAAGVIDSRIRPVMVNRPPPRSLTAEGAGAATVPPSPPPPAVTSPPAGPVVAPAPSPDAPSPDQKLIDSGKGVLEAVKPPPPAVGPASGFDPEKEVLAPEWVAKGHITVKKAFELFSSAVPPFFVDARRRDEYEAGHVPNALRLNQESFRGKTPALVQLIEPGSRIVVYCIGGDCEESDHVAEHLNLLGFKDVYVMHAGFPAWKAAGYPVETGEGMQEP